MTAEIRRLIDSAHYAEYKKTTEDKLAAYNKGYDKGYRNGVLVGMAASIGLYLLSYLSGKVL